MDKRIFELIPTDSLHYNPISKSYSALKDEEVELIVLRCYQHMKGALSDSDLFEYAKTVVDECNMIKLSNILYERFLSGDLVPVFNDDGEMVFSAVPLEDDEQAED